MRVAVMVWGGRKSLGLWNYYMNMGRILREHESEICLCPFLPVDESPEHRRAAEDATGGESYVLPDRSRGKDAAALLGAWDREFALACKRARIDVVIEQAKFLGRNFPVPTVSWIGDLQHRTYPKYFSRIQCIMRDVGFWAQLRHRRHAYVSSHSALKDVLDFVPSPRAEVSVIPFAVRPTVAVTTEGINKIKTSYNLGEPYLFLPNQLWRHKNHSLAFSGMAELARRGGPMHLVLSGRREDTRHPAYSAELTQQIIELGIEPRLRWLGEVPYSDLLHLMAGAQALVNPSLFEGWSTTVEEAKALGVPMILSNIDVHQEQASGRASFFDPADPNQFADAVEATLRASVLSMDVRLARAGEQSRIDQRIYADRLGTLLSATVKDG